eukprot:CAMPEP_0172764766 /NCGR_PEP_ID=MMETSP1074-20121228/177853_1 /TAXON_ID=2916 /ORGANISM="Ceratium fusus, Strain PA161109" /LENGTH=64 /DNA_ID=CAMNT_0013599589 /DNA_START=159 /DNA_END=350 /DNA_ORIENTATION=-
MRRAPRIAGGAEELSEPIALTLLANACIAIFCPAEVVKNMDTYTLGANIINFSFKEFRGVRLSG